MTRQPDVFVIGGGPAGLAAAISASRKGLRVMLADHARPPIDKTCGEGLMPESVTALSALGVELDSSNSVLFRGIRFCQADRRGVIEAKFEGGPGAGVRRTLLHSRLAEHAAGNNVALRWGVHVTAAADGKVECGGQTIRPRWVVGADGETSPVRARAMLASGRSVQVRFGHSQHFRIAPWSDFVEVYWGRTSQIVIAPTGPDEICVAVTSRNPHLRPRDALGEFPELAKRFAGALDSTRPRGARSAVRHLRSVHRGCFALIGDASGSVDPLTGHGLGLAFQQAHALAEALHAGDLRQYQAAHNRICRIPRLMSRLMTMMDAHPYFRARVLSALAAEPLLFSRLLKSHVQMLPISAFGLGNALRLGWRLMTATGLET